MTRIFLCFLLVALGCGSPEPRPAAPTDSLYTRASWAMGAPVDVRLRASSAGEAELAIRAALAEIERVEQLLSDYRATSELSRINQGAASSPVTVDPETLRLLATAKVWSERTRHAFDPAVGALVDIWGFRSGEYRIPTAEELQDALTRSGMDRVRIDTTARTVAFQATRLRLDPGAFGKGYALDRAAERLREMGVSEALLGIGGSSFIAVGPPEGMGWAIRPDSTREDWVVRLRDYALSTSGTSERRFRVDDQVFGHILDPRTGLPAPVVGPVTARAKTALEADILSTALFVAGPAGARAMLDSAGVEVPFRFRDHPAASPPGKTLY